MTDLALLVLCLLALSYALHKRVRARRETEKVWAAAARAATRRAAFNPSAPFDPTLAQYVAFRTQQHDAEAHTEALMGTLARQLTAEGQAMLDFERGIR